MCDLCSSEPEVRARARMHNSIMAERLRRLADQYDGMAAGRIKPHTDDMKGVSALGTLLVLELVDDWV